MKKKIIFLATLFFIAIVPIISKADSNYEYYLSDYDVKIVVNENNTLNITETIDAYFYVDKHGIYRKIPLKNKITRLDGTTSNNRVNISEIYVNHPYTNYNEYGNKILKIGNPNTTVRGTQKYVISYLYNLGKDRNKNYDEFYFNLIGPEWDTSIRNVTFTIDMPKDFDKSKLGFSSGIVGSTNSSNVYYDVIGNKIKGEFRGVLEPGEALTVRLELPDGYFVNASDKVDFLLILALILPLIFAAIALILWYKYGRDEQAIETVEFYPPQGFNSLEIGFLYNGKADQIDVISLLIYLANKGYIKITEFEEKKLFSTTQGFKITKLKEYDGDNLNEKLFLKGLFSEKPKVVFNGIAPDDLPGDLTEVTSTDLYDNFYLTVNKILANINDKKNKHVIFEKSALSKRGFVILMLIASYLLTTATPMITYGDPSMILVIIIFSFVGFIFMFGLVSNRANSNAIKNFILGFIIFIMPLAFVIVPCLLQDYRYLIVYLIGLACDIGLVFVLKYLPKRTVYGNELLGKIGGFKNFLEIAEKDKLEAMVMEHPNYFYDILPFTYVLGVSDKWIKKFETISLQAPTWYDGQTTFNTNSFSTFMNNTMDKAQKTMASSQSSGGSGGGSSGGGSGGGGGGSW